MAHYHQVWNPQRHETEAPLVHWTEVAWHWVRRHLPHLKVIGVTLAVFLVAWGIIRGYGSFTESAASQLFSQSLGSDGLPPQSVLETVAQKYPRTATGKYADWLLATQYYQDGKFSEAAGAYQRLAERSPVHKLYHVIAAEGGAYAQEQLGQFTKAAEQFSRLSKLSDNPFAEQDLLNAARNEWLAGRKDVALQLLASTQSPAAAAMKLSLESGLAP